MGTHYKHLGLEERCTFARLRAAGQTLRKIAAVMGRSTSTLARELARNQGKQVGYQPGYASEQARARRWRGSRLERQPELQHFVLDRLAMGWSPEQVAGRLALEQCSMRVSYETIYRFIDAQIRRTKDYSWRLYLPQGRSKRGRRKKSCRTSSVQHIQDRVSIDQRPSHVDSRSEPGHWETDSMLFSRYGQSLLVGCERTSRFVLLAKQANRLAFTTAEQLCAWLVDLPKELRKTLTQDNGTEFALHHLVRDALGIKTYFCDPYSPWQKGSVENANGRLRRWLPRKLDLDTVSEQHIQAIAWMYNNTPRKCLAYKTPAEVFCQQLLHFKCESTFPLSRE
jgi:IS30 family transposase